MNGKKISVLTPGYGETPFDRTKLISWWSQEVVASSRILVVGAGAIGNETLKNLALMGVGNIFICDMDTVSVSNLSRTVLFGPDDVGKYKAEVAAERVHKMSNHPDCRVDWFVGDIIHGLGHGVFRRFDVVLGCLDNMLTRANVNRRCCLFQKPYMDAAIGGLGMSLSVHRFPESSCLACGMDQEELDEERMVRYSCDVFKQRAIQQGHAATVLLSTAMVSALQVQEAIKALHQMNGIQLEVPIQYGRRYWFQGMNNHFEQEIVPSRAGCPTHEVVMDEVLETPLSSQNTLGEALDTLRDILGYECVIDIYPDNAFVTTGQCIKCHREIRMDRAMSEIYSDEFYCEDCEKGELDGFTPEHTEINMFSRDTEGGRLLEKTLEQLGVPPLHIITVREKADESRYRFVELTGDLKRVLPNTGHSQSDACP